MKKNILFLALVLALGTLFTSCKKDYESIESVDKKAIEDYIRKTNLPYVADTENMGYYYHVDPQGSGSLLQLTDSVFYDIKIKSLASGKLYSESPVNGNLGTYVGYANSILGGSISIPAIRSVMLKMKRGDKASLLIPSHLAFGKNGTGEVPSNENILLEVVTYAKDAQWKIDEERIAKFILDKGLVVSKTVNRIRIIESTLGTGETLMDDASKFKVNYNGKFLDGTTFDKSGDEPLETTLMQVIKGWRPLQGYKAGTKLRLIIPSDLAYGAEGRTDAYGNKSMPSNAILDFEIELVSVTN